MTDVTVTIVTRNRQKNLHGCLVSLSNQTIPINRLLIVDNNSVDHTSLIIKKFTKLLPIQYVVEKNIGFARAYNRGFIETKTPWVTFIDDDCVADTNWFKHICFTIGKHPDAAAIIGTSKNYFPTNPFACASHIYFSWWFTKGMDHKSNKLRDLSFLDNRNISYNLRLLNKFRIRFDPNLDGLGGEDVDLGIQMANKNLIAYHQPDIIVYHKEPTTWRSFIKKQDFYDRSSLYLSEKWENYFRKKFDRKKSSYFQKVITLIKIVKTSSAHLSLINKFAVIFIIIFHQFYKYIRERCVGVVNNFSSAPSGPRQ